MDGISRFKIVFGQTSERQNFLKKPNSLYFPRVQLKKRTCSDIFQGLEPFSSLTFCRLLVGAPYEMNGPHQTGDVYKCSINRRNNGCSKLNLGRVSQHTAPPTTHTTQSGDGNQDAHLSVNSVVSHVGDRPVGTIPVIPHFPFECFMYISTCVLYHTSHHRLLHREECVAPVGLTHEVLWS